MPYVYVPIICGLWLKFQDKEGGACACAKHRTYIVVCVIVEIMWYGWRVMRAHRLIVCSSLLAEIFMNKARSHSSVLNILHISHQRVFSHIPNRSAPCNEKPPTYTRVQAFASASSSIRLPKITFRMWKVLRLRFSSFQICHSACTSPASTWLQAIFWIATPHRKSISKISTIC